MTVNTKSDERETEVREEIVQNNLSGVNGDYVAPVDRRERVKVVRDAYGDELREHIVEDIGAERRTILLKVTQFVWLATGILELLIGLRILLKLIAANPESPFASLTYGFTDLFLWPFIDLTVTPSAGNGMILEISSLIAMLVYAVAAWGIVKLIYLIFSPSRSRRVSVYRRDQR